MTRPDRPDDGAPDRVSTGRLPEPATVTRLVHEAWERYRDVEEGACSTVYPVLAEADPTRLGICVVGITGRVHAVGDVDVPFPIMSVAKPFTLALVHDRLGAEEVKRSLGVDATGLAFDSLEAVERTGGRTNPMVNPGAIATVGLVPGDDADERWHRIHETLSRFAGHPLEVDEVTYASASATNRRNRAIVALLDSLGAVHGDPAEVLDLYTRQSCLRVTARDLAVMGATLADGGVNPVTGDAVVSARTCRDTLAVMATAGLYESSGEWLYDIGLPGKSGIGGGIVTVAPGKGGLGTFSPPLDAAGNSVRGQLVAGQLARSLGLDIFASASGGDG